MKKLILVILVTACGLLVACGQNYSNGSRVGVVTKFSKKGLMIDSWEGDLVMALPADVANMTQPEHFEFSVTDAAVAAKVGAALKVGKRVELVYKQWFIAPPSVDTKYVIQDVK